MRFMFLREELCLEAVHAQCRMLSNVIGLFGLITSCFRFRREIVIMAKGGDRILYWYMEWIRHSKANGTTCRNLTLACMAKKKTSYTRTDPFSRIHLLFESWFQGNIKKQQQTDEPSGCNFANLRTPSDTLHNWSTVWSRILLNEN